jgi:hypothetical protein
LTPQKPKQQRMIEQDIALARQGGERSLPFGGGFWE